MEYNPSNANTLGFPSEFVSPKVKESKAYVYRHIRHDKNEPFYIGIGKNHNNYTYKRAKKNGRHKNRIWEGIASRTDFDVEIMLNNLTWEEAQEKEKEFIAMYGRIDLGTGILSNLTDGGIGFNGGCSPNKGKKSNQVAWLKGLSKETSEKVRKMGEKISISNKGRIPWNKGKKTGQKVWNKGLTKETDERLLKMSIIQTGRQNHHKGIPYGTIGYWAGEKRPDISDAMKGNNKSKKSVIDIGSGIIYNSVREAAEKNNISKGHLSRMLIGKRNNTTSIRYLNKENGI